MGRVPQHHIDCRLGFGELPHTLHLGSERPKVVARGLLIPMTPFTKPGFYFLLRLQPLNLVSDPMISSHSGLLDHLLLLQHKRIYFLFTISQLLGLLALNLLDWLGFWVKLA